MAETAALLRHHQRVLALAALALLAGLVAILVLDPDGAVRSGTPAGEAAVEAPDQPVDLEGVPRPVTTMLRPRVSAATAAVILAFLLLLIWLYRRRRFILYWVAGWLLAALSLVLISRIPASEPLARVGLAGSALLGLGSALCFAMSADSYRRRPWRRGLYVWLAAPSAVLVPLAVAFGRRAGSVTGYIFIASVFLVASWNYLTIARRAQLLGAGVMAVTFALLAGSNLFVAQAVTRAVLTSELALQALGLNALIYTVTALGMHLLVFEDMTSELRRATRELETTRAELREQALTDPLTLCYNRRFLDEVVRRELERHRRFRLPLAVLLADVDGFRSVNQRLGSATADEVLRYVAAFLKQHIRECDYVFRWGGDEFLILMSCDIDQAARKAGELRVAFARAALGAALPGGVGLSLGWSTVPPHATDLTPSIREADARLYQNKQRAQKLWR